MPEPVTFLGIESSCDDTAAAVVRGLVRPATLAGALPSETATAPAHIPAAAEILSSVVSGQDALHASFGGIVPEIAARAHAERLDHVTERALAEAGLDLDALDAVAVTAGPGLIGGLLSGVMFARGLAAARGLPLVPVNHLAGHALTPRLTDGVDYPYLVLLVSGGHGQFVAVEGPSRFRRLGSTIDDAPGEAFDKVARILGLPQPGGPGIEREAEAGDPARFAFPRPLRDREGCDLSFSGLKTAVLRARDDCIAARGGLGRQDRRDLAAGFQQAVADVLANKAERALRAFPAPVLAVAGGVAANRAIRTRLERVALAAGARFVAPPLRLCTDNAAMIAWAAIEQSGGRPRGDAAFAARPRWPLDETVAPVLGSGRKGAKA